MVTLSTNAAQEGTGSVGFTSVNGPNVGTVFVQGRELGSTGLIGHADGYETSTAAVEVDPSGFSFAGPGNFTTNATAANTTLTVSSTRLDPLTLNFIAVEPLRPGVSPVSVTVLSSNTQVGVITTSPLSFGPNVSQVSTAFDPLAAGTTSLSVVTPPGFATSNNRTPILVTVN